MPKAISDGMLNGHAKRDDATVPCIVHIRCASRDPRMSGRSAARLPAPPRCRHDLPGRRRGRRLAAAVDLVLADIPNRRWCRSPCERGVKLRPYLLSGKPRRIPARLLRHAFRRRRGGRKRAAPRGRRAALSRHAWRQLRSRGPPRALAGAARRPRLSARAHPQYGVQRRPAPARPALLALVAMGEAQGQERRQLYRGVREHARDRGRPPRGGRGGLRAHSSRRHPGHRRGALHQLRRLGRELLRGRRASGRAIRDHLLGARRPSRRVRGRPFGGQSRVMRILVATDAWFPQVNGVVRTLTALAKAMEGRGVEIEFLTPEGMPTVALPSYPGIRVALPSPRRIAARIAEINPDAIHIATEGPIGLVTRWYCGAQGRSFTTSFHTRFAEYVAARWPIPERLSWRWLRWFHKIGRA